MSSTLTDRQHWRRYVIVEVDVKNTLCHEGDAPICGEGACEFVWGVPENDRDVDRCLGTIQSIPPAPEPASARAPRFPRAGDGLDLPLLWVMLAFLVANVAAWVITAVMVVGWLLAVVRGG